MSNSGNRQKLVCTDCTRRKVKCDKNTPCGNCVKRGSATTCKRDDDSDDAASRRRLSQNVAPGGLTSRVATLENTLSRLTHAVETLVRQRASSRTGSLDAAVQQDSEQEAESGTAATDDVENASTVIEFLAWGRRKASALRQECVSPDTELTSAGYDEQTLARIRYICAILPTETVVRAVTQYHGRCILWYDGAYFLPTFEQNLDTFYRSSTVESHIRRQPFWSSLLFATLSSGLACASSSVVQSWGYDPHEASRAAQAMYDAAVTCLEVADYMANPSLAAVQCIATLTLPAHLLGHSTKQSVLIATAIKIAQSLNMHQLGKGTSGQLQDLIAQETCRRVWCQLATQDFFQTPFSETNLINTALTSTAPPNNCFDRDMEPQSDSTPTMTSFVRFKYSIASLLVRLQIAVATATTPHAQYEHVIHFDGEMRTLATTGRPSFLAPGPLQDDWPKWVPWARRALRISCAHKVIMIHRKFISLSFTHEAFALTRKTCIAASKTILKCQKDEIDPLAPVLWIEHAFVVTACVILAFDLLYQPRETTDWQQTYNTITEAIDLLKLAPHSKIALRGVRLLSALCLRVASSEPLNTTSSRKRKRTADHMNPNVLQRFNTRAFVNDFLSNEDPHMHAPTNQVILSLPQTHDDMLELFSQEHNKSDTLAHDGLDIPWEMFNNADWLGNGTLNASPSHDIFCGL